MAWVKAHAKDNTQARNWNQQVDGLARIREMKTEYARP